MVNKHVIGADNAVARSRLLGRLRNELSHLEYIEIHTPSVVRSGPRPAVIGEHYSLRHSMELLLRVALSSGLKKVYEIGPAFRLGEMDRLHHPEFYMLELFQAHIDYKELMQLTESLLNAALGFKPVLNCISIASWLSDEFGIECSCDDFDLKQQILKRLPELHTLENGPLHVIMNRAIERWLEPKFTGWTILEDFPACTICLAERQIGKPHLIQRFEIYFGDVEVAHGFVDSTDTQDVSNRMDESGPFFTDLEFLTILKESKLPPSGGVGFGIERLLLTLKKGSSVSDFIHLSQHTS